MYYQSADVFNTLEEKRPFWGGVHALHAFVIRSTLSVVCK